MKNAARIMVGLFALGACGLNTRSPAVPTNDVRLALLPPSREGDAALKMGRLEVFGPCLYVVGADGSRTIPAFMTFDTRWHEGQLVVGAKRFRPGEMVRLGGGEINAKIADLAWVQQPDPSCTAPTYWITAAIDHG
jgi:hypothetical protein